MIDTLERSSADRWFATGERLGYDPVAKRIDDRAALRVFARADGDVRTAVTFMPGFPDGSVGWSHVVPHLPAGRDLPKLFVEYLGMGDSDKPRDYRYHTAERADLVEALWAHHGVQSTTLVAFDFSSLVVLEILRRRLEGRWWPQPQIRGVFIFNGGLFTDGHSHPWYTTPLLHRTGGTLIDRLGGRSPRAMRAMSRVMWSPRYAVSDAEFDEVSDVLARHGGRFFLAEGAGFVDDHRAEGERLDFASIFEAYREHVPFVVGGSSEDPFEHRQVDLAEARLGARGLTIVRLPGGHLTTHEHPRELADAVVTFERSLACTTNV